MVKKPEIDALYEDFLASRINPSDQELQAVESAMFLEECFNLKLQEEDITTEKLGSPEAIRNFLYSQLGV